MEYQAMNNIFKIIGGLFSLFFLMSCNEKIEVVYVSVSNPLEIERKEEIVEISLDTLQRMWKKVGNELFVITDVLSGEEMESQLTTDGKLIFLVSLKAKEVRNYRITRGIPTEFPSSVYGRLYPEREEDIAWENDKVGFRVYGPPLQKRGEKAYGYDLFLKRVNGLVLEEIYARELDSIAWKRINALKAEGRTDEAESLIRMISYHVDHGLGMDCYAVGPTLGAGTAALLEKDSVIVYPYCYKEYELIDNGPLRFTLKLIFHPITIGNDEEVIETRWIQLDKGSHLNKTIVSYQNVTETLDMVTGIVVHESNPDSLGGNALEGYTSYVDRTIEPDGENGLIYIGTVLPDGYKQIVFKKIEEPIGGVSGHWLGYTTYEPNTPFTYYWGFGWNKFGFNGWNDWNDYLKNYALKQRHPLEVKMKK